MEQVTARRIPLLVAAAFSVCILTSCDSDLLNTDTAKLGSISGLVVANLLSEMISISVSSGQTVIPESDGSFLIAGVDPGTYTVTITPTNHYFTEVITDVTVKSEQNTDLGSIDLRDLYIDDVESSNNVINPSLCTGFSNPSDYSLLTVSDDSWIIVDMGGGEEIVNGSGVDFFVSLIHRGGSPACWIDCSENGTQYYRLPDSVTQSTGWLDVSQLSSNLQNVRYIKITITGTGSIGLKWIQAMNH